MNLSVSGLKSVPGKIRGSLRIPQLSFLKKALIVTTVLLAIAGIVYRYLGARKRSWITKEGTLG